jgi:predicted RNA binding protein YcfA (HicA-like mRNA interferase family)
MKNLTGKILCKMLKGNGWKIPCKNGSHYVCINDKGEKIIIPVFEDDELKNGLAKAIFKKANLLSLYYSMNNVQ